MTTTCKSCGRPIIWAKTESGKRIPLDAEPVPVGNLALVGEKLITGFDVWAVAPEFHYVSHFATCPQAGAWRKK